MTNEPNVDDQVPDSEEVKNVVCLPDNGRDGIDENNGNGSVVIVDEDGRPTAPRSGPLGSLSVEARLAALEAIVVSLIKTNLPLKGQIQAMLQIEGEASQACRYLRLGHDDTKDAQACVRVIMSRAKGMKPYS